MANSPGSGRVSARTPAKLTRRSKVTFTRAWPASNNDGCPTEQKYWAMVCTAVGYHRDDPAAELLLRNEGLAAAVQTGHLRLPATETSRQGPCGRQSVRQPRPGDHSVPPRDRSPNRDRAADLLPDQPSIGPGAMDLDPLGPRRGPSAANYAMPSLGIAGPPFTTFKRPRPVPGRYANLMGLNSFCHKESE